MKIFLDMEELGEINAKEYPFTGQAKIIVDKIVNYTEGLLNPLKQQIGVSRIGYVLINMAGENKKPAIKFIDFPPGLTEKLKTLITQRDIEFIHDQANELIQGQ